MCGLTAILLRHESCLLSEHLVHSLSTIQHRGYDGAGLAIDNPSNISLIKGKGLINEVLIDLPDFCAHMGIAHTRYKTIGECTSGASQPILNDTKTICLVHNGQIEADDYVPDSVKILKEFKAFLPDDLLNSKVDSDMICRAVHHIYRNIKGAYSCVLMIHNYGLVAFRDPHGIRPLVYSTNSHGDHIVSSEDICIRKLKSLFKLSLVNDVPPGVCMIFEKNNPDVQSYQLANNVSFKPCIFEYIYLAHHNSTLNGIDVRSARKELGYLLANQITQKYPSVLKKLDWVIPVPETSCIAAQALAHQLEIPYIAALKLNPNRRKARTFILPTQEQRVKAVRNKFWLDQDQNIKEHLEGKNILLVDDSIVRGTTLRYVVEMLRKDANVNQVIVASVAPAVKYKNMYGIDIPDDSLLIAKDRTVEEIAKQLNADQVIYQDVNQMVESFMELGRGKMNGFECSLFNGVYLY